MSYIRQLLCALTFAACGSVGAQLNISRDFLVGPKDAVGLLPTDVVTGSASGPIMWSSNGNYLAMSVVSEPSPVKYRDWLLGRANEPEQMTRAFWSGM